MERGYYRYEKDGRLLFVAARVGTGYVRRWFTDGQGQPIRFGRSLALLQVFSGVRERMTGDEGLLVYVRNRGADLKGSGALREAMEAGKAGDGWLSQARWVADHCRAALRDYTLLSSEDDERD